MARHDASDICRSNRQIFFSTFYHSPVYVSNVVVLCNTWAVVTLRFHPRGPKSGLHYCRRWYGRPNTGAARPWSRFLVSCRLDWLASCSDRYYGEREWKNTKHTLRGHTFRGSWCLGDTALAVVGECMNMAKYVQGRKCSLCWLRLLDRSWFNRSEAYRSLYKPDPSKVRRSKMPPLNACVGCWALHILFTYLYLFPSLRHHPKKTSTIDTEGGWGGARIFRL